MKTTFPSRILNRLVPAPSLRPLLLSGVAGTSRPPSVAELRRRTGCDVRAACSGASSVYSRLLRTDVPPADGRAGTAQRAVPTTAPRAYRLRTVAGLKHWRFALGWACICAALVVGATARAATAAPPDSMTYQGFLVDANGAPLAPSTPLNYPVAFRIYNASSGGTLLWSEQQIVTVDKGSFSVLLGEGTAIGGEPRPALSSIFSGPNASDRYISAWVTIGANTAEILPRLRLVPSPYAFLATSAASLVQPNGSAFITYGGGAVNITGGNVGIGAAAPGRRLQIGDAGVPNSEGMIRLSSRSGLGGASRTWDIGVPETDEDTSGAGYSFVIDDTSHAGTEFMVQFGTGNVGIGTATPGFPLTFPNSLGDKISLYGQSGAHYGFGIQSSLFQIHTLTSADDIAFGYGSSASMTETMRIKGNGNVGIGTSSPATKLDVAGNGSTVRLKASTAGWATYMDFNDASGTVRGLIGVDGAGYSGVPGQFSIAAWTAHPIKLMTAGTERMTIAANGNVGIGTASPQASLELTGSLLMGNSQIVQARNSGGGIENVLWPRWSDNVMYLNYGSSGFNIRNNASLSKMFLTDAGKLGLGTTSPGATLHMVHAVNTGIAQDYLLECDTSNGRGILTSRTFTAGGQFNFELWEGNAFKPGGGSWGAVSDRRLKKDVRDLDGALESLLRLRSVTFEFKDPQAIHERPGRHTGFIAQEVEQVFPDWVSTVADGMKSVAPVGFESLTVQALRELRKEKDAEQAALRKEVAELKEEIARLKGRLADTPQVETLQRDLADLKQVVQHLASAPGPGKTAAAPIDPQTPGAAAPLSAAAR